MCFSAGASFGASAVLTVMGIATIKKSIFSDQLPFASIPFVFAVQQFSEGFVWLSLSKPAFESLQIIASSTFLIFAQMVWPLFVPVAIFLMERDMKRKRILSIFIGIGVLVAAYFAHRLFAYGVHPDSAGHHVVYKQYYPDSLGHIADALYGIATLMPTFLTKTNKVWIFGLAITISYIIAYFVYTNYILSVWCFFASIISMLIYFIIKSTTKS